VPFQSFNYGESALESLPDATTVQSSAFRNTMYNGDGGLSSSVQENVNGVGSGQSNGLDACSNDVPVGQSSDAASTCFNKYEASAQRKDMSTDTFSQFTPSPSPIHDAPAWFNDSSISFDEKSESDSSLEQPMPTFLKDSEPIKALSGPTSARTWDHNSPSLSAGFAPFNNDNLQSRQSTSQANIPTPHTAFQTSTAGEEPAWVSEDSVAAPQPITPASYAPPAWVAAKKPMGFGHGAERNVLPDAFPTATHFGAISSTSAPVHVSHVGAKLASMSGSASFPPTYPQSTKNVAYDNNHSGLELKDVNSASRVLEFGGDSSSVQSSEPSFPRVPSATTPTSSLNGGGGMYRIGPPGAGSAAFVKPSFFGPGAKHLGAPASSGIASSFAATSPPPFSSKLRLAPSPIADQIPFPTEFKQASAPIPAPYTAFQTSTTGEEPAWVSEPEPKAAPQSAPVHYDLPAWVTAKKPIGFGPGTERNSLPDTSDDLPMSTASHFGKISTPAPSHASHFGGTMASKSSLSSSYPQFSDSGSHKNDTSDTGSSSFNSASSILQFGGSSDSSDSLRSSASPNESAPLSTDTASTPRSYSVSSSGSITGQTLQSTTIGKTATTGEGSDELSGAEPVLLTSPVNYKPPAWVTAAKPIGFGPGTERNVLPGSEDDDSSSESGVGGKLASTSGPAYASQPRHGSPDNYDSALDEPGVEEAGDDGEDEDFGSDVWKTAFGKLPAAESTAVAKPLHSGVGARHDTRETSSAATSFDSAWASAASPFSTRSSLSTLPMVPKSPDEKSIVHDRESLGANPTDNKSQDFGAPSSFERSTNNIPSLVGKTVDWVSNQNAKAQLSQSPSVKDTEIVHIVPKANDTTYHTDISLRQNAPNYQLESDEVSDRAQHVQDSMDRANTAPALVKAQASFGDRVTRIERELEIVRQPGDVLSSRVRSCEQYLFGTNVAITGDCLLNRILFLERNVF
jgi:hypothetical protein